MPQKEKKQDKEQPNRPPADRAAKDERQARPGEPARGEQPRPGEPARGEQPRQGKPDKKQD